MCHPGRRAALLEVRLSAGAAPAPPARTTRAPAARGQPRPCTARSARTLAPCGRPRAPCRPRLPEDVRAPRHGDIWGARQGQLPRRAQQGLLARARAAPPRTRSRLQGPGPQAGSLRAQQRRGPLQSPCRGPPAQVRAVPPVRRGPVCMRPLALRGCSRAAGTGRPCLCPRWRARVASLRLCCCSPGARAAAPCLALAPPARGLQPGRRQGP